MHKKSDFGKNNFDRLESAGLIAGEDQTEELKAKMQTRIDELGKLEQILGRVESYLSSIHALAKPKRLYRLNQVLTQLREHLTTTLPVGGKKHLKICINELSSMYDGVAHDNAAMAVEDLTLESTPLARQALLSMAVATTQRLDAVLSESSSSVDLDAFWSKAGDTIACYTSAAEALDKIKTEPVVVCRVPVVPTPAYALPQKLSAAGFDVGDIAGYPVFNSQLVLGISPKHLLGANSGTVSTTAAISLIRDEAERLRRKLQKRMNLKLQFVSSVACTHGNGTWFWLMTDSDINRLARVAGGGHVKIQRWGFAF